MKFQTKIIVLLYICLGSGYSQVTGQLTTPIRVVPTPVRTATTTATPTPTPTLDFIKLVDEKLQSFTTQKKIGDKFEDIKMSLDDVCPINKNTTARRIFAEYGAVYIAKGVLPPPLCIFNEGYQVERFQAGVQPVTRIIDGVPITLQRPAMEALLKAREKATEVNLRISPRGGSLAAMRSYEDTRTLWNTRFLPGLSHWMKEGKLTKNQVEAAKWLPTAAQVEQVLDWEDNRQLYFSKDFTKSILYSVAAPGASQHISMLAIDIQQFADKRIRTILAENGWFQTVKGDLPHFTYLGLGEAELSRWGLKKVSINGQDFWIPDLRQ